MWNRYIAIKGDWEFNEEGFKYFDENNSKGDFI